MTSVYFGDGTFNTQIIVEKGFPYKFVDCWNDDSYVKLLLFKYTFDLRLATQSSCHIFF